MEWIRFDRWASPYPGDATMIISLSLHFDALRNLRRDIVSMTTCAAANFGAVEALPRRQDNSSQA